MPNDEVSLFPRNCHLQSPSLPSSIIHHHHCHRYSLSSIFTITNITLTISTSTSITTASMAMLTTTITISTAWSRCHCYEFSPPVKKVKREEEEFRATLISTVNGSTKQLAKVLQNHGEDAMTMRMVMMTTKQSAKVLQSYDAECQA